jgi:hypothetical protein
MHMTRLLKSAVVLGAAPLLLGTLIYGTWRFARWQWLETAGLILLPIGFVAFVMGTVALVRHLLGEFQEEGTPRNSLWLQAFLVGGLLLANFPAATFFTLSAIDVSTRYTVRVHNDTDQPIGSLVVTGPGVRIELGPVPPGQHTRRHLHFRGDGPLAFSAQQQELQFGGQLEGYVTGGLGGDKSIRVKQGGVYEIQSNAAS